MPRLLLASIAVRKSPILPVAAAVTAIALGSTPSMAAAMPAGKRDDHKVVSFPLLAVKGKSPAGVSSHVSHSSHVSGTGGHNSHASHVSHVSSVPAPPAPPPQSSAPPVAPAPTTAAPPPAVPATTTGPSPSPSQSSAPAPVASTTTSQAPASVTTPASSPTASGSQGCLLVIVAPFGALGSRLRRFARRGRPR
jgi:hypothetical protein